MIYDNYGTIPSNNLSSVFPQYITLNNYYINNNQIHSPLQKRNNIYDYNQTNNYNNQNDIIHERQPYDSPSRTSKFNPFFSPQKEEVTHPEAAFYSPQPNKPYQNFENILAKFLANPPDDLVIVKKINSRKKMDNAILGTDNGPKDGVKNYKGNETYKSSFNIFGNDLNHNNIKTEYLNNLDNYKHPLDNTINFAQKNKNSNNNYLNTLESKPKDNFKYSSGYNMYQKLVPLNEKEVNKNKKLDKTYQGGKSISNIAHNLNSHFTNFNTNENEIGKSNLIDNKMKFHNYSESKDSQYNFNLNRGKYEEKDNKKYKVKKIKKMNINNIQNNFKPKIIEDTIKGEIKSNNINKEKNNHVNNIKTNKMKKDTNKEKKYKVIKVNNEVKNAELKNINKIMEKISGLQGNTTEEKKFKFISNFIQDKSRNKTMNKISKTDFEESNPVNYRKVISNNNKNNIFSSSKAEKKVQNNILNNNIQKSDINGKNLKTDTKTKNNENISRKDDLGDNKMKNYHEKELPKHVNNENSPKLHKKKINIVMVPKVDIIEDKDNINEFCSLGNSSKMEDLNKNINNDMKKEVSPEKTSRNESLHLRKKKKLMYIVDLDERMSRFLNNSKNKDHKESLTKSPEQIFKKIKKSFQTPAEKSKEKSEFLLNPDSFKYLGVIGEGEYGKIYLAQNIMDNQYYAMKIEVFDNRGEAYRRQVITKLIKDVLKKTNSQGIIKIYGDIWLKKNNLYNYYVLMEKAEIDMEQELIIRCRFLKYYSERELTNVLCQLIVACAQLQRNNIAHRDIKPQNILILNGLYKLCDFGEAKLFNKGEVIIQRIRGSELYMSPVLFFGMKNKFEHIKHNVYKSDVFSLGLSILLAGTLDYDSICQIRELTDMEKIKNIVAYFLSKRYSNNFISFLLRMLEVDENKRPDFLQLESLLIKK